MKRACIAAALGILGFLTAACDGSPSALVMGASSITTPSGQLSPTPIVLTPFGGIACPGGFGFGASFNLFITAGINDLTLDHVTLHLIDGTNVGGPEITIPTQDLVRQSNNVFIRAGTTRAFAVNPGFGCVAGHPLALHGNVFLFDRHGLSHTVVLESRIQ